MRQAFLFLISLLMLPSLMCIAQNRKSKKKINDPTQTVSAVAPEPRVWIANIPTYNTTRADLLSNPFLITDSVGCKVSGFTLSLQAPGHDFYGPLYVNGNEFSDVQKEIIKKWDYENVTLFVQDIHLNCHESDARSSALKYFFSH